MKTTWYIIDLQVVFQESRVFSIDSNYAFNCFY